MQLCGNLWTQLCYEHVFTCGSCQLERSPDHIHIVADPVKFQKLLKSHYFSQVSNIVDFCVLALG